MAATELQPNQCKYTLNIGENDCVEYKIVSMDIVACLNDIRYFVIYVVDTKISTNLNELVIRLLQCLHN